MVHEAKIAALIGQAGDECNLGRGVFGANRAYRQLSAIAQCHGRLELDRVGMNRHVPVTVRENVAFGVDNDASFDDDCVAGGG